MQRSLTRLSSRFPPVACSGFVLHPSRFLGPFVREIIAYRKDDPAFVGNNSNRRLCLSSSVLLWNNSHRNYCTRGGGGADEEEESSGSGAEEEESSRRGTGKKRQRSKKHAAKDLSKKIFALGKKRKNWNELLDLVDEEKHRFTKLHWAAAFARLARARHMDRRDPRFESAMADYGACLERHGLQWAGIRQLADVMRAIGYLKLRDPPPSSIIGFVARRDTFRDIVRVGKSQDIATIAWSLARLGVGSSHEHLFEEIETRADWLVANGNPREIGKLAWASAALGVRSPRLFAAIETRSEWLVETGPPRAVSDTAWAFAALGVSSPKLFANIENRVDWLVTKGTPKEIADTAWAFATLDAVQTSPTKLFANIETRAEWLIAEGKPQAIADTAWAFATSNFDAPKLFASIETRTEWLVKKGTPQDVSNLAVAFANRGCEGIAFFEAVANHLSKIVNDGSPQNITSVCYSMAVSDFLGNKKSHSDAIRELWDAAIDFDPAIITDEDLRRLGWVFAFCTAGGMKLRHSPLLAQKIKPSSDRDSSARKPEWKQEIATILEQLGLVCEQDASPFLEEGSESEIIVDNSILPSIDFTICKKEHHMVAIELYAGESRFLKEPGTGKTTRCENGPAKAKRRFLQQMGWNVVAIDYRDWMDAKKNDCQSEFVREKLNSEGGIIQA